MFENEKLIAIESRQTNKVKNELHGAIKEKNFEKVRDLMETHDVDPSEEISQKGFHWTCLHYAAHFNTESIMEYLLKRMYQRSPEKYVVQINSQTNEGWTPIMICAIYRSLETLTLILKIGGCRTDLQDNQGKTALDLAEHYGAIYSYEKLKPYPLGEVPLNLSLLCDQKDIEIESSSKFKELFLNGILKPCIYCQSNLGNIKYSNCCGAPMHKPCLKERVNICWECNSTDIDVENEFKDPEKAFIHNNE